MNNWKLENTEHNLGNKAKLINTVKVWDPNAICNMFVFMKQYIFGHNFLYLIVMS